jgi:flagellar hook-associated protein 1 FlgK
MRSTFGGFNTVVLGLQAAQLSIDTTGNNVSNANTTGYSRQTVNLATNQAQEVYGLDGPMLVGTVVQAASITRARDTYLDAQYWQQNGTQNYWQDQSDNYTQIENVFKNTTSATSTNTGLQAAINQFYTALGTLASNASDTAARTNVREDGNALAQTMQQAGSQLQAQASDLTTQIADQVSTINTVAGQIASLNAQIVGEQATGASPNDLMDRRDNLVDQLSALASVNVNRNSDGSYNVTLGGANIVQGSTSMNLTVNTSVNPLYNYNTCTVSQGNNMINISGGSIGSMIQMRDQTINGYLGNLDSMAKSLLVDFNSTYNNGYAMTNSTTVSNQTPQLNNPGYNFFGSNSVNYSTSDPTQGSPPKSWLSQLTVNSDLYTTTGTQYITASDTKSSGTANGNNATALANLLQTGTSAALGNTSLNNYFTSFIGALGIQSQQASDMNTNAQTMVNATSNLRQSVSGVNLDEEMTNMIKYQQAYGACAKMMTTVNSMISTLISAVGTTA